MFNFDDITKEDIKEHNPNWPKIPDHPYRISIVAGSLEGLKPNIQKSTIRNTIPQITLAEYIYIMNIYIVLKNLEQ